DTISIKLRDHLLIADKLKILSVAPLLGEAIRRIHEEDSISSLFV
ncbi:MAG: Ribose-phosphate pyrophosphokinase, partial [Parcubacteria group bacterium GW2011_GWC2_42_6]